MLSRIVQPIAAMFAETGRALIDFIFPPVCLVCGAGTTGAYLCESCLATLGDRAAAHSPDTRHIEHLDGLVVLLPYDEFCRTLVHALKYHGIAPIGPVLGGFMGRKVLASLALPADTLLVPVPLHPAKLARRGYNQSERLASGFAAATGLTIVEDCIARTRDTGTQTALDADSRRGNVHNAFRFSGERRIEGGTVVLIDDVATTGSTLTECARALRDGGAGRVYACVAASPKVGND